jgi:oxaloacetate decarboxylase alpha subunit
MTQTVGLIDTTLRDGQQSHWATRMTTAMMLPILPEMDAAGFDSIETMATVHFDVCVRYLHENPLERMRLIRLRLKKTPTRMLGMTHYLAISRVLPDDVVELFTRVCAQSGTDIFWITASLNDARTAEFAIKVVKSMGLRVEGGIQFTVSPVHTDEFFANTVRGLVAMGVEGIVIKDAGGLLTPERATTLVPAVMAAAPGLPIICHSHCVTGMGPASNHEAIRQGVSAIWTASHPLANGASLPSADSMVRSFGWLGYECPVDPQALSRISDYFTRLAARFDKPLGRPAEYDPTYYAHQLPGGMVSNFRSQLVQLGLEDRLGMVLEELPQVREDLGWPNMQTPYSQFLATQALLNVLHGRYEVVPDEVRNLALGYWGRTPGPVNPNVLDRIAGGQQPIDRRPGELVPPAVERVRAELGPSASDEDVLLAILWMPTVVEGLRRAGPIPLADPMRFSPLVDVVAEAARGGVRSLSIVQRAS